MDVIPIDKYDYFAINFFLYKEFDDRIVPLACSRIMRYSECVSNDVEFTPLILLSGNQNKNTKEEILQLNNEPALMMKFRESPTQHANRWMDDSRGLWENREQCF